MLALVWVHHQRQLAVLLAYLLWRCGEAQVELLIRIELEGVQNPASSRQQQQERERSL